MLSAEDTYIIIGLCPPLTVTMSSREASLSAETTRIEVTPSSDHLDVKLRRSNRRVTASYPRKETRGADGLKQTQSRTSTTETTHRIQGEGIGLIGPKESSGSGSDSKEVEDKAVMAKKGVQKANAELAKMERRLERATKRQKAKVAESTFETVRPDYEEEAAFKPEPIIHADQFQPLLRTRSSSHLGEHLPTPEREPAGGGSDSHKEGDPTDDINGVTNKYTVEVADGGAARQPPVNRDYLPLPWTGRLGYVSSGEQGNAPADSPS